MQFSHTNKLKTLLAMMLTLFLATSFNAFADKKIYTENEFLDAFSGKSTKVLLSKLGEPFKKSQSVKPSGAKSFMQRTGAGKEDKSKPVKVEMWYYKSNVTYDGKRTYKETEVTLVNGRAMNIAFFNNR